MTELIRRLLQPLPLLLWLLPQHALATQDAEQFESALAAAPEDVDLRLQYALYLSRNGDPKAAQHQALKVLETAPDYLDAHLLLGRIAGWQREFDTALYHVNIVLAHDENNPASVALKLDLLRWMGDYRTMEVYLIERIRSGFADARSYALLAEAERASLKYLSAYRHAQKALRLDPNLQEARALAGETRRVSLQMVEEFEYYDFSGEEAARDRKGSSFTAAATAFPAARFSASVTESVVYRFRSFNHQIALRGDYRPRPFLGLTLMGAVGSPARVIPKGTVLAAVRGEMLHVMDASVSTILDVLAWPAEDPAVHVRAGAALGVRVHPTVHLGAAYTIGLLRYCGRAPSPTHSGTADISWTREAFTLSAAGGYAEERDPLTVGVAPPDTCGEIDALSADLHQDFRTAKIQILHGGLNLTLQIGPRSSLLAGYRFERKETEPYHNIIPTHISHFGLSVWF